MILKYIATEKRGIARGGLEGLLTSELGMTALIVDHVLVGFRGAMTKSNHQTKQPPEGGCLSWGLKIRLT